MWKPVLVISLGSALSALLRWVLSIKLNSLLPTVRPGTLTANLMAATPSATLSPPSSKRRPSRLRGGYWSSAVRCY